MPSASIPWKSEVVTPEIIHLFVRLNKRLLHPPTTFKERVHIGDDLIITYELLEVFINANPRPRPDYVWVWIDTWVRVLMDVLDTLMNALRIAETAVSDWMQRVTKMTAKVRTLTSNRDASRGVALIGARQKLQSAENGLAQSRKDYERAWADFVCERERFDMAYKVLMHKMGDPHQKRASLGLDANKFDPLDPFKAHPLQPHRFI